MKLHNTRNLRNYFLATGRIRKVYDEEKKEYNIEVAHELDIDPLPKQRKHWNNKKEMKAYKKEMRRQLKNEKDCAR